MSGDAAANAAPEEPTVPVGGFVIVSASEAKAFKPQRAYQVVPAPEIGEGRAIRLQSLNSSEVSAYEASNLEGSGVDTNINLENSDARLLAWGWVDAEGVRVFNPREADQVRQVGRYPSSLVKRCVTALQKLSGMGKEDKKQGKAPTDTD